MTSSPAEPDRATDASAPVRIGFVLEQALGHVTHGRNLTAALREPELVSQVAPVVVPIPFGVSGWRASVPVFGTNWTVRAGLRARRAMRTLVRHDRVDALFVHTQVPAMLAGRWLTAVPTVVSLDATPLQYDRMGAAYDHSVGSARAEAVKRRVHRHCFDRAAHLVCWSEWARHSLVADYGIDPERVSVVAPGVDLTRWTPSTERHDDAVVRLLFVGGDLARKGGFELISAVAALRRRLADETGVDVHLDLVTAIDDRALADGLVAAGSSADALVAAGAEVHRNLQPNSVELVDLYRTADVFCLPSLGDCFPLALSEAAASGLAIVATDVGATAELVRDGVTGLVVAPGDIDGLASALHRLVTDVGLRAQFGAAARALVEREHDARRNAARLVEIVTAAAERAAPRTVMVVSGEIPTASADAASREERPRADYLELAAAMHARLVDVREARLLGGRWAARIERVAGVNVMVAWVLFRHLRAAEAIVTDGEHVGLPYAALSLGRFGARPRHHMVAHAVGAPKKVALVRVLGLRRRIDSMIVYSPRQRDLAIERWHVRADRILTTQFMVDTAFFRANASPRTGRRVIASVGLERRDYETLVAAVDGLDADVVVAAGSSWSRRTTAIGHAALPANVTRVELPMAQLRELYESATVVAVPLVNVDFPAGITTILEAMAMARPVVATETAGHNGAVVHGVTGVLVPPGDAVALRAALIELLADPERAEAMGAAGRALVEADAALPLYARRIAVWVDDHSVE